MASVPPLEDHVSASTPKEAKRHTKSCKRYLSSPFKEIDVLSPIRKSESPKCNLFCNLNSLDINTSLLTNRSKILVGVSRKLRFTELSNLIEVNENKKLDNDSGIECDKSLSISKVQNISNSSTFSTDENSNFISNCDITNDSLLDNAFKSDNLLIEVKTCEVVDDSFEILNRNNLNNLQKINQQIKALSLDILGELNLRNCSGILSLILSYLTDEDLRQSSYVCQEWKNIIVDDCKANHRRKAYIKKKKEFSTGPDKENRIKTSAPLRSHNSVFLRVINAEPEIPQQPLKCSKTLGRFDSFIQEAQTLPTEVKLTKCPKCLFPSKAESGSKFCCTRSLCQHVFCKKCYGPYLDNHSCCVPKINTEVPRITIGSRKSKKNLKRL